MSLYLFFLLLMALAVGVSLSLALYAWRHRRQPGALPFLLLLLGEVGWLVGYSLELFAPTLATKIIWDNLQYHASDLVAAGMLLFALAYTGRGGLSRWYLALLFVPLHGLLLIWTDPYHHMLRTSAWIETHGSFPVLAYTYGPWFWITVAYDYLLVLSGFGLMLVHTVRTHRFYRLQAGAVVLGMAIPLLGSLLTVTGMVPIQAMQHLDISPLTFALANPFLAWGLFRQRLFDLVPVARNRLVALLPDGVMVLDAQQRIVDINPAAQKLLGPAALHPIGTPIGVVLPDLLPLFPTAVVTVSPEIELLLPAHEPDQPYVWVEVAISRLQDRRNQATGWLVILRDISGRKQAEEAYRTLVTHSLQALVILQEGRNVFVNPSATRITGYTQAELLAMSPAEAFAVIHPDDRELMQTRLQARQKGQEVPPNYQFRLIRKDSAVRWIECFNTRIEYRGRPAVQMAYMDITEQRQAEESLRESQQLLRSTLDSTADAIIVTTTAGQVITCNQQFIDLWNLPRERFDQMTRTECMAHMQQRMCDPTRFSTRIQEWYRTREQDGYDTFQLRDGRTLECYSTPYRVDGQVIGRVWSYRDITARTHAEARLREQEALLRAISDNLPDAMIYQYVDLPNSSTRRYVYVSAGIERLSGITATQLYADSTLLEKLILPEDWTRLCAAIEMSQRTASKLDIEIRKCGPAGDLRWSHLCASPRTLADGRTVWDGIEMDITARKWMEEEIRASRARVQAIFDNAAVGIGVVNQAGYWIDINRRGADMLGYTPDELHQLTYLDITYAEDQPVSEEHFQALLHNELDSFRMEKRYVRKDGSSFWAELSTSPIRDEIGAIEAIVGVLVDITDRKRAEAQLHQANTQLVQGMLRLQQHNQEVLLLNQLVDLLLGCLSAEEAYEVVTLIAARLFVYQTGALYLRNPVSGMFERVAQWGDPPPQEWMLAQQECWGLRRGHSFLVHMDSAMLWCQHVTTTDHLSSLCVPLVARGETIGLLHLRNGPANDHEERQRWQQLAEMVAGHVAMALTNLLLRAQLQEQVTRDPLTGLFNRRYLDETLNREIQQALRHGYSVGVMMLDIDRFKHFNDTYGHDTGDALLRAVGAFLQTSTRGGDIACRYGGEEFTLVLPGAALETTWQRAEEVRAGINALALHYDRHSLGSVTISLGVAAFPEHGMTGTALLKAADIALYKAKLAGRNRVMIATVHRGENGGRQGVDEERATENGAREA